MSKVFGSLSGESEGLAQQILGEKKNYIISTNEFIEVKKNASLILDKRFKCKFLGVKKVDSNFTLKGDNIEMVLNFCFSDIIEIKDYEEKICIDVNSTKKKFYFEWKYFNFECTEYKEDEYIKVRVTKNEFDKEIMVVGNKKDINFDDGLCLHITLGQKKKIPEFYITNKTTDKKQIIKYDKELFQRVDRNKLVVFEPNKVTSYKKIDEKYQIKINKYGYKKNKKVQIIRFIVTKD